VEQGRYATSQAFVDMGVVGGADITVEAAVAKTMFLLANTQGTEQLVQRMGAPIAGEFTLA
jgi:L-asparaginase